jgi:hypothetical protein
MTRLHSPTGAFATGGTARGDTRPRGSGAQGAVALVLKGRTHGLQAWRLREKV